MKRELALTALTLAASALASQAFAKGGKSKSQNVLFIVVDDMRPEMGCYNSPMVKTPNIDRLAEQGALFTNAYCNIPVSGASRTSLLTGLRPTNNSIKNWDASTSDVPDATPINKSFQDAGYTTIANGKVFHHAEDQVEYWDTMRSASMFVSTYDNGQSYKLDSNNELMRKYNAGESKLRGNYSEGADCDDSEYLDYRVASQTIEDLKTLSEGDKPFFLACGFSKPHLPFVAPKRYFDMYDPSQIVLPSSWKLREGHDIPLGARNGVGGEMLFYSGVSRKRDRSLEETQEIIRGYYACVSFIDVQIGRVLDELEALGLADNTTVVLIGDHGWNLAEHGGMFCKQTILYHAIRSTMIIRTPGGVEGIRSNEVVEFVDLYPTLCDVSGVKAPKNLEGESIKELCYREDAKSKGYAVSRWYDGWSYTDGTYYYAEWYNQDGDITERMLFDHTNGIDDNYNLVEKPYYRNVAKKMQEEYLLHRGERWNQ
ncbi:MAG: sulfatase [Rikenellaceae bacterium]